MKNTCFGSRLDAIARDVGGWPDEAIVHTIEVIGTGENPQVLLTGSTPSGERPDGRPKFELASPKHKSVVRLAENRTAIAEPATLPELVADRREGL